MNWWKNCVQDFPFYSHAYEQSIWLATCIREKNIHNEQEEQERKETEQNWQNHRARSITVCLRRSLSDVIYTKVHRCIKLGESLGKFNDQEKKSSSPSRFQGWAVQRRVFHVRFSCSQFSAYVYLLPRLIIAFYMVTFTNPMMAAAASRIMRAFQTDKSCP